MEPMYSYLKQFWNHTNIYIYIYYYLYLDIELEFMLSNSPRPQLMTTSAGVGSAFAFGLAAKLAELIRLPKENFLVQMVSGRISALAIVMKLVMRLAGARQLRSIDSMPGVEDGQGFQSSFQLLNGPSDRNTEPFSS